MTTITRHDPIRRAAPAPATVHAHAQEGVEHRVLYALVFAVCFALAALLRLAPRRIHPWISPSERPMSLVAEARAAADSTVPYVFQVA